MFLTDLFRERPASYESRFSVSEALERLHSQLQPKRRPVFFDLSGGLVGVATTRRVVLGRFRPGALGMPFPLFIGTFHQVGGVTSLTGCFRVHRATQAFVVLFVAVALGVFVVEATLFVTGSSPGTKHLGGAGLALLMLGLILFLARVGVASTEEDVRSIEAHIRNALGGHGA